MKYIETLVKVVVLLASFNTFASEYEKLSQGKSPFIVLSNISKYKDIFNLCENADGWRCSVERKKYSGMKGVVLQEEPIKKTHKLGYIYPVIMENNDRLFLTVNEAFADKEPVETIYGVVDLSKYIEEKHKIESLSDTRLAEGLSYHVTSAVPSNENWVANISNGEELSIKQLNTRLKFLKRFIPIQHRDKAFDLYSKVSIGLDEAKNEWSINAPSRMFDSDVILLFNPDNGVTFASFSLTKIGNIEFTLIQFNAGEKRHVIVVPDSERKTKQNYSNGTYTVRYFRRLDKADLSMFEELGKLGGEILFIASPYQEKQSVGGVLKIKIRDFFALYNLIEKTK